MPFDHPPATAAVNSARQKGRGCLNVILSSSSEGEGVSLLIARNVDIIGFDRKGVTGFVKELS